MSETKNNRSEKISNAVVVLGIVIGVILLLFGGGGAFFSKQKQSTDVSAEVREYDEIKYEEELVRKIEAICSQVKGAGKVSVAVTLDGSYRAIYAQNSSDGANVKKEYLLVGSGSSESALLVGYSPPKILGVGVVCSGGVNAAVRAEMIALISATLDLPTNKIYVTASKN
jgi:stage III sporulation protein AG